MAAPSGSLPIGRYLGILAGVLALLYALVFFTGDSATPKLGLDLQGGTQVTLQAKTTDNQAPSSEALDQARQIIERRVNGLGVAEAHELARTLAAWFSVTLIAVLLLSAIGWFMARRRPWRRTAGWWILAAGLACLLGSQLILFPVAFIFFVAAGVFALRPVTDGSPS